MLSWLRNKQLLILLPVLAFLFLAGEGPRIIQYPPRSVHAFRQGDCLAYTKTYYQHNSGFFTPSAYNLIGREGRVVSEFPILYYISAKLCRLFGFQYWIIRGVTFLCYVIGLCYLFLCCRFWTKAVLPALFCVVILASSPYFFYYAVNYLPNVPAICLSFAGLYYMLLYERTNKRKNIIAGTIFFAVACLLKPTDGGLIPMAYAAVVFTDFVSRKKERKQIMPVFFGMAAVILCSVAWFFFVKWYNDVNGNKINLQGFYPLWDMPSFEALGTIYFRLLDPERAILQHFTLFQLAITFLAVYILKWKSLNPFLRSFTLWLMIGSLIYAVLWFKAFTVHDYYLLIFAIPIFFLAITILSYYYNTVASQMEPYARYLINITLLVLMVISIYNNQAVELDRYADKPGNDIAVPNRAIFEVEPYLRKIGISAADSVLSVPDVTPNVSLAAFGNRGYTSDLFAENLFNVKYCQEHGIKYMIISVADYINKPEYKPFTSKLMGEYKGIYIYDIRPDSLRAGR